MPLVIYSLGGGHTDTDTHIHTSQTGSISRNCYFFKFENHYVIQY